MQKKEILHIYIYIYIGIEIELFLLHNYINSNLIIRLDYYITKIPWMHMTMHNVIKLLVFHRSCMLIKHQNSAKPDF